MSYRIRKLEPSDNSALALVIRKTLEEHGVARPGTVYTDPTTDDLYSLFKTPGSCYFVVEEDGQILGGCGVFPTEGLPDGCAELVKLYILQKARGKGIGFELMDICAKEAVELGYSSLYLETLHELSKAVTLYKRSGYRELEGPLGKSGHYACSVWMLKELK